MALGSSIVDDAGGGALRRRARRASGRRCLAAPASPCVTALGLGAGSGRVSGGVLLKVFERVHLVEMSAPLLQAARTALCDDSSRLDFTLASISGRSGSSGI